MLEVHEPPTQQRASEELINRSLRDAETPATDAQGFGELLKVFTKPDPKST
jgi:hypothetical protein